MHKHVVHGRSSFVAVYASVKLLLGLLKLYLELLQVHEPSDLAVVQSSSGVDDVLVFFAVRERGMSPRSASVVIV
jgi:hypothetical protein